MTVAELIRALEEYPRDLEVVCFDGDEQLFPIEEKAIRYVWQNDNNVDLQSYDWMIEDYPFFKEREKNYVKKVSLQGIR